MRLAVLLLCLAFAGCAHQESILIRAKKMPAGVYIDAQHLATIILIPDRATRQREFWDCVFGGSRGHIAVDERTWMAMLETLHKHKVPLLVMGAWKHANGIVNRRYSR